MKIYLKPILFFVFCALTVAIILAQPIIPPRRGGGGSGGSMSVNGSSVSTANLTDGSTLPTTTWSVNSSNITLTVGTNFNGMNVTNFIRGPRVILSYTGGTNVSGFDWNAGSEFILFVTNTTFFPAPSNVPNTNVWQSVTVHLINDGTGGYGITFTNLFKWINGIAPVITTNANAYDVLTFMPAARTNGNIIGYQGNNFK